MKRVTFGIDTNPTYAFFAPLTAALWESFGYRALVLCVGAEEQWRGTGYGVILDALADVSCDVAWIEAQAGHLTSTVAQVARLFAWRHEVVAESDYVLTSDADMWPLSREWFEAGECGPGQLALLYENSPYPRFPMCYQGAHRSTWREIIAPDDARTMAELVADHLGRVFPPGSDGAWGQDEAFATQRIKAWSGFPSRCKRVRRADGDPPSDRIDRAAWPAAARVRGKVDAHLVRPGFTEENWPRLLALLEQVAPDVCARAAKYHRAYMEAAT